MDENELIKILIETARRVCKETSKCCNLVYSQNGMIREPELKDILSKVFSEKRINYGIEVPTKEKYGFSGSGKRAARIDLSIFRNDDPKSERLINIELKGDYNQRIAKDFEKLMREKSEGACFFQVLAPEYINETSLKRTKERYKKEYIEAKDKCSRQKYKIIPKWFLLFILIVKGRDIKKWYGYKFFKNIRQIDPDDFISAKYEEGDLK